MLASSAEDEQLLAGRLRRAVDAFNQNNERQYRISISIGMSCYDPEAPAAVEDLVEQADLEMYRDKQERRARRLSSGLVLSGEQDVDEVPPAAEG